jgi:Putative Flp pilus-assembly TadE/G-like
MLRPLIRRPLIQNAQRRAPNRHRERGVTLALVAVAIFSIIAMASLSIDVGTLYQASAEAQRAADSAALAAARAISISGITGAATPTTDLTQWQQICGGASGVATQTAVAVAQQNTIGGAIVPTGSITVLYAVGNSAAAGQADCSTLSAGFAVNPVVTVTVTQSSLPTYFSRIWGRTGSTVSATASAEAFNPSNSNAYASGSAVVPVQPRCVKPWMVPNLDPLNPPLSSGVVSPFLCSTAGNPACKQLVGLADGSIQNPGILAAGSGIIGETFWMIPDCHRFPANCTLRSAPQANYVKAGDVYIPPPVDGANLEYLPAQAPALPSTAVPTDGDACTAVASSATVNYAEAIAGCDQHTVYQCGVVGGNTVDLSENPALGDTTNGVQCLTHQGNTNSKYIVTATGQDTLQPFATTPLNYPFQIQAGTNNPISGASGNLVTSSTSIVSLPIYDNTTAINATSTTTVTVIGFLQVFVNYVDANGSMNVTVMNVAGCGNAVPSAAPSLTGTSPVPVRLITPP